MTAGDPVTGSPFAALADDTEGCICLVAGYANKDGLIARVTAEADRQVKMSPALDDFLQLRYVDLGARPGHTGDWSGPARTIAADLMTVQETAGRSHFALIVIAKSARIIDELLRSCAADPFIAGLRPRFAGIASSDDREQETDLAEITSSPAGGWQNERQLVDALHQRCEELPRYFAARGEPGLTRAGLAALRDARARPAGDGNDPRDDIRGAPEAMLVPDVLDDAPEATETRGAAPGDSADSEPGEPGEAGEPGEPGEPAAERPAAISAFRWLPRIPWQRTKQTATSGDPDAAAPTGATRKAVGLVYLLTIVDHDVAADPALGRFQAALLDLDKRLAAQRSCGYQVRLIHGNDGSYRGELQDAGRLARRDARRPVKTGDFTTVLKAIRGSLRRDGVLVQAVATAEGLAVAPPTVVIFTADPPMADLGAAAVFGDLADDATVVWVVPGKLEGLVSPAFGSACGAAVLGEHQGVADEILDMMPGNVFAF